MVPTRGSRESRVRCCCCCCCCCCCSCRCRPDACAWRLPQTRARTWREEDRKGPERSRERRWSNGGRRASMPAAWRDNTTAGRRGWDLVVRKSPGVVVATTRTYVIIPRLAEFGDWPTRWRIRHPKCRVWLITNAAGRGSWIKTRLYFNIGACFS